MFREHQHLARQKPAPRPKWMAESVVDPDWLEKHRTTATANAEHPFTYQWELMKEHLRKCFDPALFKNGKGVVKRPAKLLQGGDNVPARNVQEAVIEFLCAIKETLDAQLFGKEQTVDVASFMKVDLEELLWDDTASLMRQLLEATETALENSHQHLDEDKFTRGIWEHFIAEGSEISAQELVEAGIGDLDERELEDLGLKSIL